MTSQSIAALINVLGFLAGAMLYGLLLVMTAKSDAPTRFEAASRRDRLPLVTAVLGLLWNVGSLVTYAHLDLGAHPPLLLVAASLTALGFLPAVVVHTALPPAEIVRHRASRLTTLVLAYVLSSLAAAMHLATAFGLGARWSEAGLRLLTIGFLALMPALYFVTRRQSGWQRAAWGAALSVFAVSAFHLSYHTGQDTWVVELLGHHASLPLAVAILYQDYRFALVDVFLKRALTFVALMACALALFALAGDWVLSWRDANGALAPGATAALLALWMVTALAYPTVRAGVHHFVDAVILRRADYTRISADLERRLATLEATDAALDLACASLTEALAPARVLWRPADRRATPPPAVGRPHAIRTFAVPTTEAPCYEIEVAGLTGGRRLLSDEYALLEWCAQATARRIDALRVAHERCERTLREQEIGKLATEAELRALQAQLNPHFLFNALTTIGFLIQTSPERALETLMRLTSLLRAVLRRTTSDLTTLGEELDLVESYVAIERARFEERLRVRVEVEPQLRAVRIPPLVVQPLVENAIKHAIARNRAGGDVTIAARLEPGDAGEAELLSVTVTDTGPGEHAAEATLDGGTGVGLSNIRERLARTYDGLGALSVRAESDGGTTVRVVVPVTDGALVRVVDSAERLA